MGRKATKQTPIERTKRNPLDPVITEIVRNGVMAVTEEMKTNLMRTAYNMIIYEALDFTVGLFTPQGETISIGIGLPMFIRGMAETVTAKIRHFGSDGIKPGDLVLDGPTVAKIFLGQVKSWDDPAIAKLNPGAKLPKQAIAVVHRSDGSGTTFNFTDYLSKVSPDWKTKVGSDTAVEWPVGIGAKGNEGVSANIAQTKGAIGYVEYAYAKQNKLVFTKMLNKDGKTVSPVLQAFQAAAANADWNSVPGYGVILSDQPGAESWPMTAATFILIHKQPQDPAAATEALKFFAWAYSKGAKMAEDLDYVPMPASVSASVEKVWTAQIKDASGKSLYAAH